MATTEILTDPDDHDYPVAAKCGECGHEYAIDPVSEENLDTVKHPVHGGYVLTTHCPSCHHVDPVNV